MPRHVRDVRTDLRHAATMLNLAADKLGPAWAALQADQGGYPSSTGGGGSRGGTPAGLEARLLPDGSIADIGSRELDHIDRTAAELRAKANNVIQSILAAVAVPDAQLLNQAAKANEDQLEAGCSCCARIDAYSPPYTAGPTTVHGNLDEGRLLCRWCYDFVRANGRLPSLAELADHHARPRKVRVRSKKKARR